MQLLSLTKPPPPQYRSSFIVHAEDNARAEKRVVLVGERSPVVALVIPEALGGNADTLASDLSDNGLHNDFVGRDVKCLHLHLDLVSNGLCDQLCCGMVVLLVSQVPQDNFLNAGLYLGGVESKQT